MPSKLKYSYFRASKTDEVAASAQKYRELRLKALKASPLEFSSNYELEADFTDTHWTSQLTSTDREVFICAATPSDIDQPSANDIEWVGQITVQGPLQPRYFSIDRPEESDQASEEQPDEGEQSDRKGEHWQILSFFTLPEHQGQGQSRYLWEEALNYLRSYQSESSIFVVRVMVREVFQYEVAFYEVLGFLPAGRVSLAELLTANGEGYLLPADASTSKYYSARTELVMNSCVLRLRK